MTIDTVEGRLREAGMRVTAPRVAVLTGVSSQSSGSPDDAHATLTNRQGITAGLPSGKAGTTSLFQVHTA